MPKLSSTPPPRGLQGVANQAWGVGERTGMQSKTELGVNPSPQLAACKTSKFLTLSEPISSCVRGRK